jgi:DNA end-binding protein Ku
MMRYADEVVEAPEVSGLDRIKVPPKELKLATDLIDALATEWEPARYSDDYQKNLQEVIQGKLKGETVVIDEDDAPIGAEVIDLAERLRRSLAAASGARKTAGANTKAKGAKTAKRAAKAGRKRAA